MNTFCNFVDGARPGGEEADDEKSVRSYNGNPQGGQGDRYTSLEEQGEPR